MHWHAVDTHHLTTEMNEPSVMPNVCMSEQNTIDATGELGLRRIQSPSLSRKARRAFDKPTLAGNRINDSKAGGVAPHCRIAPRIFAAILFATRLRETSILRGAEHNGEWPALWFGTHRRYSNGRAGEELAARYFQVLSFSGLPLVVRI